MDAASASKFVSDILDFVRSRPWLNSLTQVGLILGIAYVVYVFAMGRRAGSLRSKLPWLRNWYGKKEIRDLIASGEYAHAGERLVSLGNLDQAIEVFQRGNLHGRAADIHLRRHQHEKAAMLYEKAGDFVKAGEIYLERKQYDRAETVLEKAGKTDELGALYEKFGAKDLAAKAYAKAGQMKEAATLLVTLERPLQAAEAFSKAYKKYLQDHPALAVHSLPAEAERLANEAARYFEQGKQAGRAAEIYLEINQPREAARCYAKFGDAAKAAQLYEKIGDLKRASEVLAASGKETEAARLEGERLHQQGDSAQAIAKFQEAGDFIRAAEIYRDLQENRKAAAMYERAQEFALAASLYKAGKHYEEAARAFERVQMWRDAIECYRLGKMPAKEAALLEKIGDYVGAADNMHRRGLTDEALAALEQVKKEDPRYRSALSLKGKIYLDKGDAVKAKEFFEDALQRAERLNADDIDTIYNMAVASDQTQTENSALQILERMLAQDLVKKDAVDKAKNVRQLLTERAFTKMPRTSGPTSGARMFAASDSAMAKNTTTPAPKRYQLIKEIGRGGMGIVFTAKDSTLDRVVALKVLPSSFKANEQAVKTFLREAKSAASLNHPNIVTVHDLGVQEGEYYIAMELIDGKTIKEILKKRRKLTYASVFEVLSQLFDALSYAHSKNVVHRDLTTNNIMWTKQQKIKIMDFGLAKFVKELMSEQSIVGGTPSYMSPEQTLGKPIDHRTDIYSVGICIYEMCIGELPFKKGDLGFHHVNTPPPIPKERAKDMPDALNTMILRCMEKDPENRYQDVREMQEILAKIQ